MAISEYASLSGVTVSTTEYSITDNSTTLQSKTDDGVYQLRLDCANMQKNDVYRLRVYEKILSGGSQRLILSDIIAHAQSEPRIYPSLILMHGFEFSLQKLAGTDRAFDASIVRIAGNITEPETIDDVSVGTSEISIISGNTTLQADTNDGIYQAFVDLTNLAKADKFRFRFYETVRSGGTKRKIYEVPLEQPRVTHFVSPALTFLHGWDGTLIRTAGADRNFDASIRKAA